METGTTKADLPPDLFTAETTDTGRGRLETRTIMTKAEVVPHLAWPGATQVARRKCTRQIGSWTAYNEIPCKSLSASREKFGVRLAALFGSVHRVAGRS